MKATSPVIAGLEAYEQVIAENQPQFIPLPVLNGLDGRVISRWELTADELNALNHGQSIFLSVMAASGFPPVDLFVMSWDETQADEVRNNMRLDGQMELRLMHEEIKRVHDQYAELCKKYESRIKDIHENKSQAEAQGNGANSNQ